MIDYLVLSINIAFLRNESKLNGFLLGEGTGNTDIEQYSFLFILTLPSHILKDLLQKAQ